MLVALPTQHAIRMRRLNHLWPARLCSILPHCLINGPIFGGGVCGGSYWNKTRVFCFSQQVLSEIFLILRRIQRDMIKNVYWCSRNVPLIVVRF